MIGIGVDIYSISKFARIFKEEFANKYFTDSEKSYLREKNSSYFQSACGIFCAKEAFFKALGSGIAYPMKEISVEHDDLGKPYFKVIGGINSRLNELQAKAIHLSISHDEDNVVAFVIIE